MGFRLNNDVRPAGWSVTLAAAVIATTLVAGVVVAIVRSNDASRGQKCHFASTTSVSTPLMVVGSDFRLSLPDGWAWIEPHAPNLDAQVQKAAAADQRLRAFFLGHVAHRVAGGKDHRGRSGRSKESQHPPREPGRQR